MSVETAGKASGAVTVHLTPQQLAMLQEALKVLQEIEHQVAIELEQHLVDFDEAPFHGAVAAGTDLTQQDLYSFYGVSFSSIPGPPPTGAPGGVFAAPAFDAPSSPNVCSLYAPPTQPWFSEADGTVRATFTTPVRAVSIDVVPVAAGEVQGTPDDQPYLKAFNATGGKIDEADYPLAWGDPKYGTAQTLLITHTQDDISYVEFSVAPGSTGAHVIAAAFDNLAFKH
jgi:hypothetical protein